MDNLPVVGLALGGIGGFNAHDAQQGFDQRKRAVQEVPKQVVGRRYEKGLADLAVQPAFHLTSEEIAKIEDGGQASVGPHNVAALRRRRLCRDKGKNEH